eukprot:5767278-Amphidinium_carterae.1
MIPDHLGMQIMGACQGHDFVMDDFIEWTSHCFSPRKDHRKSSQQRELKEVAKLALAAGARYRSPQERFEITVSFVLAYADERTVDTVGVQSPPLLRA